MSVTTTTSSQNVTLISRDERRFVVPLHQAERSATIKDLLAMVDDLDEIPLPGVTGDVLSEVVRYLDFYQEKQNAGLIQNSRVELYDWELEFFTGSMNPDSLETVVRDILEDCQVVAKELNGEQFVCQVYIAADFLAIDHLIKICAKRLALLAQKKYPTRETMLKGLFNIEHDGTDECDAKLCKEYTWLLPMPTK